MLTHSHLLIEEKASIIHKLKETIARNTDINSKINEMKELGKQEAELEYKKQFAEQLKEHRQEVRNVTEQYEHILEGKTSELHRFTEEFKTYHKQKKEETREMRREMSEMYKIMQRQHRLIKDIENGSFTAGIHTHHIPITEIPSLPDRENYKLLYKALEKTKTLTTLVDNAPAR